MDNKPNPDRIEFKLTNKRPKKNAVTYKLVTVQDIFNCVTNKNIKKFMREFEVMLRSGIILKDIQQEHVKDGMCTNEEIKFTFTWIDD